MMTNERLDSAKKNAQVIEFDSKSRFFFFSDVHRGDDSVSDEFSKNQTTFLRALDYYMENGYTYVEVGDGEDLWEYGDFKVIRLAHADVYARMRKFYDKGRLIILYGNHNIALRDRAFAKKNFDHFCDEFNENCESLFPDLVPQEGVLLQNRENGNSFLVVHGHQGDFFNDQLWRFSRFLLHYIWRFFHVVGLHSPTSPAKVLYKRHKIEKKYVRWIRSRNQAVICGHTHRPRFPRKGKAPYYNTGCCTNVKGITGIEIVDGNIQLVDWRNLADREGIVRVTRTVVRGPRKILF